MAGASREAFLLRVFNDPMYLEQVTGLDEMKRATEDAMRMAEEARSASPPMQRWSSEVVQKPSVRPLSAGHEESISATDDGKQLAPAAEVINPTVHAFPRAIYRINVESLVSQVEPPQ